MVSTAVHVPHAPPTTAECRTLLADGRIAAVTASRRPRANRADVKCATPGAPALAARMAELVRLARHSEARLDSRDQVVLSMDIAPAEGDRSWELAAVLADRMVRGAWHAQAGTVVAVGWCGAWHLGSGLAGPAGIAARLRAVAPAVGEAGLLLLAGGAADDGTVTGVMHVPHLGALTGHADPSAGVASARTWFPLHSGGINDSLAWVEVSVRPMLHGEAEAEAGGKGKVEVDDQAEERSIAAPGVDAAVQLAVRQVLAGARHFDGRGLGRWRTVVRFSETRFQGNSYELALVMADRLARGREFVPRGRVIATGCSSAWHAGKVEAVDAIASKMQLIAGLAGPGDRILLPEECINEADNLTGSDPFAVLAAAIRARGASLARIARIGLI